MPRFIIASLTIAVLTACTAPSEDTGTSPSHERLNELQDDITRTNNELAQLANEVDRLAGVLEDLEEAQTAVDSPTGAPADGPSPEPTTSPTAAAGQTITFEGGEGNTATQRIPAGDYLATVTR